MPLGASRLGFWFLDPGTPPPPPGPVNPTPINNIADYIVVSYSFTDGRDLDTRTKMTVPVNGSWDWVGWGRASYEGNILFWGGDNTGTGVESVLINVSNYKTAYPAVDTFRVEFNCYWYSTAGLNPVYLNMTMYTGGSMVKQGYTWANPSASSTTQLLSTGKQITLVTTSPSTNGEPLGYIEYNVTTGVGSIDIYP